VGSIAVAWIVLAALLLAAALWLRRGGASQRGLRVLARLPLEPRRSLLVVEIAGRTLLLASSESGISMLVELDAAAAASFATQPREASGLLSLLTARTP
jgi:flagellar biosynthetic protein FliO